MNIANELGKIEVADDVIARIANLAASQCEGIKSMTKNVRVTNKEDQLIIDLYVAIKFGMPIEKTAKALIDAVRKSVYDFTGLEPTVVNVTVEGIEL